MDDKEYDQAYRVFDKVKDEVATTVEKAMAGLTFQQRLCVLERFEGMFRDWVQCP